MGDFVKIIELISPFKKYEAQGMTVLVKVWIKSGEVCDFPFLPVGT
jgi:hypothetical protein